MTRQMNPKTRTCDITTPEALIMSLYSGSGVLLINSDEFKVGIIPSKTFVRLRFIQGFYEKCILNCNESAICSAFTCEPIKHTTIKRGNKY